MKVDTIEARRDRKMVEDPSGFFLIFIDKERQEIVVEYYKPVSASAKGGDRTATGRLGLVVCGTSAEALCHTIARGNLVSRFEHASYLGREIQKAELALKFGLDYDQDEELIMKKKK
jgi:tetrahydromethanopterin S-methyltransferase subunit A